jgi:hypothetical protein
VNAEKHGGNITYSPFTESKTQRANQLPKSLILIDINDTQTGEIISARKLNDQSLPAKKTFPQRNSGTGKLWRTGNQRPSVSNRKYIIEQGLAQAGNLYETRFTTWF